MLHTSGAIISFHEPIYLRAVCRRPTRELFEEFHRLSTLLFDRRVRDQTDEAAHLVPEADGGLQECDHHGLDVLVEERHRPLRPHPQVQTAADVGAAHQSITFYSYSTFQQANGAPGAFQSKS